MKKYSDINQKLKNFFKKKFEIIIIDDNHLFSRQF